MVRIKEGSGKVYDHILPSFPNATIELYVKFNLNFLPFSVAHPELLKYVLDRWNPQRISDLVYFGNNVAKEAGFCLGHQHPKR